MLRCAWVVVLVGCRGGMSAKECDQAVEAMTARIEAEDRALGAARLASAQLLGTDRRQDGDPRLTSLATAAAVEPTFARGAVLRYGAEGVAPTELAAAVRVAHCDAKAAGTPGVVYLAAPATALARDVAPVVAQLAAAKVEPRLLVQSRERVQSTWPPTASAATKKFFEDLMANDDVSNRMSALAERVKGAISGCSAIGKRIEEAGEGASSLERQLAFPRGLRDCKCAADPAKVESETWMMVIATYTLGGLPLRAQAGATPEATLGELVRELRLGPGTTLAVGEATAPGPATTPGSCEPGVAFEVSRDTQWNHPAPPRFDNYVDECLRWVDECRAEMAQTYPFIEVMIDVGLTGNESPTSDDEKGPAKRLGEATCRWQTLGEDRGMWKPRDVAECSKDRAQISFDVPPALTAASDEVMRARAELPSYELADTPDQSWGHVRIRRYQVPKTK